MNTDDIIELAREAGFTQKNVFSDLIVRHSSGAWVDITDDLTRFAALVTQAERDSRKAAQAENEQLKARLARSGVELRKAVRDERKECKAACDSVAAGFGGVAEGRFVTVFGKHTHQAMSAGAVNCAAAIEARNHIVELNKKPGLALDSGEFVPAEKITDWASA